MMAVVFMVGLAPQAEGAAVVEEGEEPLHEGDGARGGLLGHGRRPREPGRPPCAMSGPCRAPSVTIRGPDECEAALPLGAALENPPRSRSPIANLTGGAKADSAVRERRANAALHREDSGRGAVVEEAAAAEQRAVQAERLLYYALAGPIEVGLVRTAEATLTVLRQASAPLGPMDADWLAQQERRLERETLMERLVQILLLSPPAVTPGHLAALEGLVLGLDEAGVLWTGKLMGTGGAWSVLWTEVADPARVERDAALKAQDVEADKRRP